jgi:hypothetical protein
MVDSEDEDYQHSVIDPIDDAVAAGAYAPFAIFSKGHLTLRCSALSYASNSRTFRSSTRIIPITRRRRQRLMKTGS